MSDPEVEVCAQCGHAVDSHDRRAEDESCAECFVSPKVTLSQEEWVVVLDLLSATVEEYGGRASVEPLNAVRHKIWAQLVAQAEAPSEDGALARIAREYKITLERLKELVESIRDEDGFPELDMTWNEYWAVQDADTVMLGDCGCFDSHADDCPNALSPTWREPNYSPLDQ